MKSTYSRINLLIMHITIKEKKDSYIGPGPDPNVISVDIDWAVHGSFLFAHIVSECPDEVAYRIFVFDEEEPFYNLWSITSPSYSGSYRCIYDFTDHNRQSEVYISTLAEIEQAIETAFQQ